MKIILPHMFLIITFALTCLLSYALGTSFGVAGTAGVIFMTLARSGGVDPVLTAGVIMSGIYFGDRGSPVSSSANMVAGITETEIFDNVKLMMKTGLVPLGITIIFYGVMSVLNPVSHVDAELVSKLEETFCLSPWAFLPALFMLVLPLMKVGVIKAMTISIVSGVLVAWLVQGVPLGEVFHVCVFGYVSPNNDIGTILNGGGLVSMVEIAVILVISSAYSGIFNCTHMLDELQSKIGEAAELNARNEKNAAEREERLVSAAQMEARKVLLAAKQEMVEKAYIQALDKLCAMPEEQYVAVLAGLLVKASSNGKEEAVFSKEDRERVGKAAVAKANELSGKQLRLSEETQPIRGGFILKDKNVEVNCTFETLVRLQKAETAGAVVKKLFA